MKRKPGNRHLVIERPGFSVSRLNKRNPEVSRFSESGGYSLKEEKGEVADVIDICIFGQDGVLTACRAVLDALCPTQYDIRQCTVSETPQREADIYIWEAEVCSQLPAAMATPGSATKLIIVSKPLLSSVRSSLPHDDFVFLNSPMTPLALRVFLESTIARLQLRGVENSSRMQVERDRILQMLLETNAMLQDYDRDRTNFLTRAVHDIRVPLMAVQGYCGLLVAGQLGNVSSEQALVLEKMQRSLTRLGGLIAATMDLGTGVNAQRRLNLETGSLEGCINQAVHEILPLAEQKQINLNIQMDPPIEALLFDASQLEQVLVNLLDNGCKFSPKRGSIEIRGYSVSADDVNTMESAEFTLGYRIDISDTGPGIPSEHIEQIFDEYTSYGGATDRSGSGLGLAICRMIVNAHNGRIWATSGPSGAKFSLVFPYARAHRGQRSNPGVLKAAV